MVPTEGPPEKVFQEERSVIKHTALGLSIVLAMAATASAGQIRITEYMYSGLAGEFVELTNVGITPVDMTGWSYDDSDQIPGAQDLSAFGIVDPGESVVFTEADATAFSTAWSLIGVSVIGGVTNNLSRNDEINIYDNTSALVDRLGYGDQTFVGSIRTQNKSGNPTTPAALGANDPFQWTLAANADAYGSYVAVGGDIGNPGHYVPEPTTAFLVLVGVAALIRRR